MTTTLLSIKAARPMWCDDFDMDLYKVIPEARQIIARFADIKLVTRGGNWKGTLNHPSCWNGDTTMLAFFRFGPKEVNPDFRTAPGGYETHEPIVECTFEEAIRDCWSHSYCIFVEETAVFDSFKLRRTFEDLMWILRKWREPKSDTEVDALKARVLMSLEAACRRFFTLQATRWNVTP